MVLSGGGATGAYEVGVMKALFDGASPATDFRPVAPGVFTGTSAGALNATVMASRSDLNAGEVVRILEGIWLYEVSSGECCGGNGVYRLRGIPALSGERGSLGLEGARMLERLGADLASFASNGVAKAAEFVGKGQEIQSSLLSFLSVTPLVSDDPLKALISKNVDLQSLRSSEIELAVVTTNWSRGCIKIFSKKDIVGHAGTSAILASAAIPGIFSPVTIGGEEFVDGGVLLNTPISPSVRCGASEIHLAFLDATVEQVKSSAVPGILEVLYRMLSIIWAKQVKNDLLLAHRVNQEVGHRDYDGQRGAGDELKRRRHRKLTVHVYRPSRDLGGAYGLLDFQSAKIESLIDLGYQDAARHDCGAAGCVLPGKQR